MRLASRSQYAITAMLELALSDETEPTPLLELSHKLNISLSYMEQLFARLRQHGLVKARRGPGGGYKLSRPLRDIMVSDIVCAVEDINDPTQETRHIPAPGEKSVSGRMLWKDLSKQVHKFLSGISLEEVMDNRSVSKHESQETKHPTLNHPVL